MISVVKINKNNVYLSILIVLSFTLLFSIDNKTQKPTVIINPQDEVVNLNPDLMKVASLGQQRLIASLLWAHTMLKSDLKHYKVNDLKNWMYLRVNAVITLSPLFYEAYYIGAQYLSIVKDDDYGAKDIYDRALSKFSTDYNLLYGAGFHYFYELGETKRAIQLFKDAIKYGSPLHFLPSLVARMEAEEGDLLAAKTILEIELAKEDIPENAKQRLKYNLYSIKAEIDLNCLNNSKDKTTCNYYDLNGKPYIKKRSNIYIAPQVWRKFQLKRKVKN